MFDLLTLSGLTHTLSEVTPTFFYFPISGVAAKQLLRKNYLHDAITVYRRKDGKSNDVKYIPISLFIKELLQFLKKTSGIAPLSPIIEIESRFKNGIQSNFT